MKYEKTKYIEARPEKASKLAKKLHIKKDEIQFIRKSYISEKGEVDEKERSIIATVSTADRDRDGEIIEPTGIDLKDYQKNPVLMWAHTYKEPPIGRMVWGKIDKDKGMVCKFQFAKTQFADEIYQLYKDGYLKGFSIGFVPLDFDEKEKIHKKIALLEISAVPVPSNQNALIMEAYTKGIIQSERLKKDLEIEVVKDKEIEVVKGKDGVTIFGRPVVDSETGEPIAKEDMADKEIEIIKEGDNDKKEKEIKGETKETAGTKEEKGAITKPETTDKYHRIPVNTSCKITATITISASKGIKALYCGKEKKIHTYLFDVKKFSMEEAKAWVKENSKDIDIESIAEKVEPIEEAAVEADKGEEEKQEEFKCECISCGWEHTSDKHCDTYKCDKCGGEMRRISRPGPGKDIDFGGGHTEEEIMNGTLGLTDKQKDEWAKSMPIISSGVNASLESAIKGLTEQVTELKEGRVLSTKNRTLVKDIRDLIRDLDGKLTSLLDATEPTSREEERAVNVEHQVIIEKDDDKASMDKLATAIEKALNGDSLKKMLDKSLGEAVEVAIKKKLGKVE